MTTISHERANEPRPWTALVTMSELWASLAIAVIWLAVLFASVYAPDIVTREVTGAGTTVPAGVAVALFAAIATWPVAKYGYRRDRD